MCKSYIKLLNMPGDFARRLNPFVQAKYAELWQDLHPAASRYLRLWHVGPVTSEVSTIDELMALFPDAIGLLAAMKANGVTVDHKRTSRGQVFLMTDKADVARSYDMHEESEFFREV